MVAQLAGPQIPAENPLPSITAAQTFQEGTELQELKALQRELTKRKKTPSNAPPSSLPALHLSVGFSYFTAPGKEEEGGKKRRLGSC